MQTVREAIIVEGRYDRDAVLHAVNAVVLETSGFGIFSDKEKASLFRRLADTRGIIVLTDSDGAGFLIRNHLRGILPPDRVKNAYIPDVPGKERRKTSASKEGKLGVEGMSADVILNALINAGATFEGETPSGKAEPVTKLDFYTAGLSGKKDSALKRAAVIRRLGLPERLTANGLLEVINALYSKEEFFSFLDE